MVIHFLLLMGLPKLTEKPKLKEKQMLMEIVRG